MTTTTPNMSLVLPDVSITTGPQWATLLNAAYALIDSHDHSSGKGVAITPSGLNISSDLTFAQHNATNLRSARLYNNLLFTPGINDRTCLYSLNNELYYIDGAGNNVQVTLAGSINIGTTSSLTLNDTAFILQYFGDATRKVRFSAANIPGSTTRVLTFDDSGANDNIPTNSSTSVFKNKVLVDTTTSFGEVSDNTKAFKISLTSATTAKTMTLSSAHTNNRTLTLPDATDTLVGKATTDDLTNKSFNGVTVVKAANALRFNNTANTFYTSLNAGANVANYAAILPISDGSSGQVLKTDGAGQWAWTTAATTTGVVAANDSNVVFTNADNRHQSCLPTAVRTYTLPTTAISAGDTWDFDNQSLFLITINSSGGNLIGYVWPKSSTRFVALVTTPTTAANWNPVYETTLPGVVQANDAATTFLASDNRMQLCTPTAARVYTMPTTGITAGDTWTFYNQATAAANTITIQSSGSNSICLVPPLHKVVLIAVVSTPTTAAHWVLADRQGQLVTYTPTITGGGTVTNNTAFARLIGDKLRIDFYFTTGTVVSALGSLTLPFGAVISASKLAVAASSGSAGACLGSWENAAQSGLHGDMLANSNTSTSVIYFGGIRGGASLGIPTNGVSTWASASNVSGYVELPVTL